MSSLDTLIRQLCPNGVQFEPLAAIGQWYGGGTPSKGRSDFWQNGTIPWVSPKDMGRAVVDTAQDYITEAAIEGSATRLVPPTSVAMVVRSSILDRVFPSALIPVPVALNQDMKAVVPRRGVLPRYLAHLLRARGQEILRFARKTGGSVASIESSKLFAFRIPVPPIQVQEEIVRRLDEYSSLEGDLKAELEAEMDARRVQYAHYRDELFIAFGTGEPRKAVLSELADFKYGFTASAAESGDYRFLRITDITPRGKLSPTGAKYVDSSAAAREYLVQPGDLLMARTGATYGKTMLVLSDVPVVYASFLIRIRFKQPNVLPAYYWHFAQSNLFWSQAKAMVSTGGQPQFNANVLKRIEVPVPSVKEQERIVALLDRFDEVINELSIGLPDEISLRRAQYEHYRDRLLTFQEAVA